MDSYTGFAEVYDTFMDETPYGEWADYISQLILQYGISQPSETEVKASSFTSFWKLLSGRGA